MKIHFKLSPRREILLDFFLVFLFTVILIKPYFKAKYTDKWSSIESTFIADARFLSAHWPHPQWQPLWYNGTRFDYIYPPALRYGTAVISKVTGFWPVKAYHFYVATLYCIGMAGVYLLMRIGSGSRGAAWLAAAATATMSPIFLFMPRFRGDSWMWQPQRLGVLVKYGEGPHMSALALIPIALAFAWIALDTRKLWATCAAALCVASVVSNNFYGAVALACFYPVMVWAFWITRQNKSILVPAIAIPIVGYALTAFWLVPSYFKVTTENMKYVSEHGTTWSIWVAVGVAVAFAVVTDKFARGKAERTWEVFIAGSVVFFSLNVLGNYYFNFRISGEPLRLLPELDMIYIMAIVLVLRMMWNRRQRPWRIAAGVIVAAAFATTLGYIRHAWHMFPLSEYQDRIEYKVTEWIGQHLPDQRILPSGSVRFWFDAWRDLPQLGGGSDQGILNGKVEQAQWEINLGQKPAPSILWLQCMGVDAVYVSDEKSQEYYKDFEHPRKFESVLPVIYDDGAGNRIYRVPRRYLPRARVVERTKLNALKPPRVNDDIEYLQAYADVMEKGPDAPVILTRKSTDVMQLRANVAEGQSLVVQESYDPAWRATSNSAELPIHADALGMIAIDVPAGDRKIDLVFVPPMENLIGRLVSAITLLAVVALLVWGLRKERAA
ncbi:MAG TPA: hypothetical protein VKE70_08290 [Candidatus Solibacter sp.]|nr:hypothetical protein [Candidatus Solibacter sp.]